MEELSGSRRSSVHDVLIDQPYTAAIEKAVGPSAVLLRKAFSLRSGDRGSCSSIRNLNVHQPRGPREGSKYGIDEYLEIKSFHIGGLS